MTLASSNPFPSILAVEGTTPATPSAGQQRLFIRSSDHVLCYVNSSGTVTAVGSGMTNPMTTTGDMIYSSSGTTPARLAVGTAAQALMGGTTPAYGYPTGVPWTSGTSMPGSPATNQRITRTDLGLDFYYDGTRWLSSTLYHFPMAGPLDGNATAANNGWPIPNTLSPATVSRMSLWHSDFAIWLVSLYGQTYTGATNNGSNYWTFALAGTVTNTAYGNFTTAADTAATHTGHVAALNQVAGSTERGLTMTLTKTGTPGTVFGPTGVTYRLIGV